MYLRILIIDDDQDFCMLLKRHLVKKNYIVYLAHTLAAGNNKVKLLAPDVLILDNQLPDGSGWTNADIFNTMAPDMQMILISAYRTPRELLFADDLPVTILEKPLSLQELDQALQRMVAGKQDK